MQKRLFKAYYFSILFVLFVNFLTNGCSPSPIIKTPDNLPHIVKEYKHFVIPTRTQYLLNTELYLDKGDFFSILADSYSKRYLLTIRVEEQYVFTDFFSTANESGNLYIGSYRHPNNRNPIGLDIIVWREKDWAKIANFLQQIKDKAPDNEDVAFALDDANKNKEISLAEVKTLKEMEEIKVEIEQLKEEPERIEEKLDKKGTDKKSDIESKASIAETEKRERISNLESRLENLAETLTQLDEMKKQLEAERKKSRVLMQELAEKEEREKELFTKLQHGSKIPPLILIASPENESKVELKTVSLFGVVEDDQGLKELEFFNNNKLITKGADRGVRLKAGESSKRLNFRKRISLDKGINIIKIKATDNDGLISEKIVTIHYVEKKRNVWAVVIGVNSYPHIRKLKYAVSDAKLFHDYLVEFTNIPKNNVTLLLDEKATLTKIRSALGTHLKRMAGKDDMVIIYFAGHGATEKDVMSSDGDGLEKYLLPFDANPRDLYATAMPMREISHIFNRIQSERLVFMADSCYSGASGGRTINVTGIRASISDAFLDRIASGKGRVIMTASGANEVSAENDDLKHGVFTYYMVEGLKGKADADKDGLITVDEVYRYVYEKVPQATGQEQHPVKKGTVEGQLVLSIIE